MNINFKLIGMIALLAAAAAGTIRAQDADTDRVVVAFSNPSKPGRVRASLLNGSIAVRGYQGKEVVVEAKTRDKAIVSRSDSGKDSRMKKINLGTSGLTVEEKDNVMTVDVEFINRSYDLSLQVPFNTSLELEATNGGTISVDNVSGEIEANHTNGSIFLTNISGTALADTTNGKIKVVFLKIDAGQPMAWSTTNGDIDVTLPADAKATLKMKTETGDVYSDFDVDTKVVAERHERDARKEGGKYRITFEKGVVGAINGGGPEFLIQTLNGSIFIRKGK